MIGPIWSRKFWERCCSSIRQYGGSRRSWRSNARWRAMIWCWPRTERPIRGRMRSAWSRWPRRVFCGGDSLWRKRLSTGCGNVSLRVSQILDANRPERDASVEAGAGSGGWRVAGLPYCIVTYAHPAGVVREQSQRRLVGDRMRSQPAISRPVRFRRWALTSFRPNLGPAETREKTCGSRRLGQ